MEPWRLNTRVIQLHCVFKQQMRGQLKSDPDVELRKQQIQVPVSFPGSSCSMSGGADQPRALPAFLPLAQG